MNDETLLNLLKTSLPVKSTAYDDVLQNYLHTAIETFDADINDEADMTLVILYAAWMWDSRKDKALPKPPALQMAINNRAVRHV